MDGKTKRLVSVIIVNFNGGELITDCVEALLACTTEVEVIVFDNNSQDDSIPRLRAHFLSCPQLTIIEGNENIGFSGGANHAYSRSEGEYVLFLNPDCIVNPDTLERMADVMDKDLKTGMAGCLIRNKDGSEQSGGRRRFPTPLATLVHVLNLQNFFKENARLSSLSLAKSPIPDSPVEVEAISGAFMFVRRNAIAQIGPLDEGYFLHCEDLDWCMRFSRQGYKILFVPDVEALHYKGHCSRGHEVSAEWHKHRGMLRFYRKFYSTRYPIPLMWAVYIAVITRFGIKVFTITGNRLQSGFYSRKAP